MILPTPDERLGIDLAMAGVAFQQYSLPPRGDSSPAQLVFITTVRKNDQSPVEGVLLGYTRLNENPFTRPIIENLHTLSDFQGIGMIVDEEGMIIYHPDSSQVGNFLEVETGNEPQFIPHITAPDGTRQMMYVHPIPGRSWLTVTMIPMEYVQQLALENAAPILTLMLLVTVIGYLVVRLGLRNITSSLQKLASASAKIAMGDLDHKMVFKNQDEIGRLGQSLDQMRVKMKTRMDEADRLLFVSSGAAASLEMNLAVKPILKGALAAGASSARIILTPAALPESDRQVQTQFGLGPSAEKYRGLDSTILAMTESEPQIVLPNPQAAGLVAENGGPIPAGLLAIALYHENVQYGTLWIAYDHFHTFTQDEVHFLSAVAGQAALAASNARLYLSEQLGRQRFEAILTSTPDPVLVTDHQNRLLVANPAAVSLLGNGESPASGTPIDDIIEQEELLDLLYDPTTSGTPISVEVDFPGDRTYHATASPVLADGYMMGRVCVLTDVTHFKTLDALKSEFVSTVSHDLRSPLTLMRGYATMLQMVGELNEQQAGYIDKIVNGIESMSFLVNNLLDLGRIEAGVGLDLEMVPVEEVTRQVIEGLHLQAVQKHIDLTFESPSENSRLVEADQALLHQAIYNLVDNAIKYTNSGGKVAVSIKEKTGEIAWVVQDTGIGISPVDLPRVFEPFFKSAGQRSGQHKGSGLGLTIVKSIAERHGGSAKAESQLGKGSTFTFAIPLHQQNEP
jgi:signal transduction histidine kinase/HAMP domain-containing protein